MRTMLLAAVFAASSTVAIAQATCGSREDFARALDSEYGERQYAAGITGGNLLEIWASPDSGTWTVMVTKPDGISCIMASGEYFQISSPRQDGVEG